MLEYGIRKECPEPSNFVSNLLVTKKRNSDCRILLDCRLLNNETIPKATVPVSHIEVKLPMQHKKLIFPISIFRMLFSKY
jgi:hypothetical protein